MANVAAHRPGAKRDARAGFLHLAYDGMVSCSIISCHLA